MKRQFETIADFINMGGHGFYVWMAWGISALVIIFLFARSIQHYRQTKAKLENLERENKNA